MSNLSVNATSVLQSTVGVADKKAGMNNKNPTDFSEAVATRTGENLAAATGVAVDTEVIKVNEGNLDALRAEELKAMPADLLIKALRDAGIEENEVMLGITRTLVQNGMELTEKNISQLFLLSQIYKDVPVKTLALMMKLEIPITANNISQFTELTNGVCDLAGKINTLIENLPQQIISESGGSLPKFMENIVSFLDIIVSKETEQPEQALQRQPSAAQTAAKQSIQEPDGFLLDRQQFISLAMILKEAGASDSFLSKVAGINRQTTLDKNQLKISVELLTEIRDFISAIPEAFKNGTKTPGKTEQLEQQISESLKKLFEEPSLKNMIKMTAENRWLIKTENLSSGNIEKYFKNLSNAMNRLEGLVSPPEQSETTVRLKDIQNNLNLQNELNRSLAFLQIPLKLDNQITNSDLYVFADGKRKSPHGAKHLNILLRLELNNMGKIDIYVNMAGKDIRSRFFVQDEGAIKHIEENLVELNETVTELGFNFTSTVSGTEKGFNFIDDFINRKLAKTQIDKLHGRIYG